MRTRSVSILVAVSLVLLALQPLAGVAEAAPIAVSISGEIERIAIDNPNDMYSGGRMVVGGQVVILPRHLLLDLPANRLTLQQLFAQAPAACLAVGETGLAKADLCNTSKTGGIGTVHANRTNAGDTIAGDVFIQKGVEAIAGLITYIDYADGYFRVGGITGDAATGVMVRFNDPGGRHSVQQGAGCIPGSPNCSPDPRFTLDPDNYTIAFASGFPACIPSTVSRQFTDVLDLDLDGNRSETLTAQSLADGSGDLLCPQANRTNVPVDDSRRLAPIRLGDHVTAEGNFETIGGVRYISAFAVGVSLALETKNQANQPDYFIFDEVGIDVPGFQNQRVKTLFIGFMTIAPTDVVIWSLHRDQNNVAHELPLATSVGCDNAGGVGTCLSQGLAGGGGGNIFKIRHDVDFLVGAKPELNPCAQLRADPRFASQNICPLGGTMAEMFGILSPAPHEIVGRTGRKIADLQRPGGPIWLTVDINGVEATNGEYLFPLGLGLGGLVGPEFVEIDLNKIGQAFNFDGLPWLLDRRLGPGGCDGPCGASPLPLDPFPYSALDPRFQASLPSGPYTDRTYTASTLTSVKDRILSYVDQTLGIFNGDSTVLAFPPLDPPAQGVLPTPPLVGPDTISPTVPSNVQALVGGPSEIFLSWSASIDNIGVAGYEILRDAVTTPVTTVIGSSLIDSPISTTIAHSYTVVALDAAGNRSAPSTAVSSTATIDTAPPEIPNVTPAPGSIVPVNVAIRAMFSEGVDPATVTTNTFTLSRLNTGALATPLLGTVAYDPTNRTASFAPGTALAAGATYTAVVKGGAGGVSDLAGNTLASDRVWSFATIMVGDVDGNGRIDILDIQWIAARSPSLLGDALYDSRGDLDADGDIDILDVRAVAGLWGTNQVAGTQSAAGPAFPALVLADFIGVPSSENVGYQRLAIAIPEKEVSSPIGQAAIGSAGGTSPVLLLPPLLALVAAAFVSVRRRRR